MEADNLENRVAKLKQALFAFSEELHLAFHYTRSDAASSLTKSRIVMEKILLQVFKIEMRCEPRKPLLGEMLADNQFTRKIERRIVSRMNAIRDLGNLGPHGEEVEPSDAMKTLDDLCEVLDWYLRRYPQTIDASVDAFIHPMGSFEKRGDIWVEEPPYSPGANFVFREIKREGGYIYLCDDTRHLDGDPSRVMYLRLPLRGGMSQWSFPNPFEWQDLYLVKPKQYAI